MKSFFGGVLVGVGLHAAVTSFIFWVTKPPPPPSPEAQEIINSLLSDDRWHMGEDGMLVHPEGLLVRPVQQHDECNRVLSVRMNNAPVPFDWNDREYLRSACTKAVDRMNAAKRAKAAAVINKSPK